MMLNEREKALKQVQMYQFALVEAGMFLDTHPDNQDALEYFNKYQKLAMDAQKEYMDKYGPINYSDMQGKMNSWKWIKGPWPWEGEAE